MQPLRLPYPGLDLYPVLNTYPGHCNFMNKNRGGMDRTPLGSWRRAQQSPAIRFRIGPVVVEESDIKLWERQGIYKDNSHKGQRFPEF